MREREVASESENKMWTQSRKTVKHDLEKKTKTLHKYIHVWNISMKISRNFDFYKTKKTTNL